METLLAGRDYQILEIDYDKVEQARDRPHYLLIDRDGSILAKGIPPAQCALEDAVNCQEAPEKQAQETAEATAEQTEDKDIGGLSDAAALRGFRFPKDPVQGQEANALSKRGFIIGHIHVSAVLGWEVQVGYRLTDQDSLSLSYVYDWYTKDKSNSFVGVSYQRNFAYSSFVQTGLGRLESKIENYETEIDPYGNRSDVYGTWHRSRQIGP